MKRLIYVVVGESVSDEATQSWNVLGFSSAQAAYALRNQLNTHLEARPQRGIRSPALDAWRNRLNELDGMATLYDEPDEYIVRELTLEAE